MRVVPIASGSDGNLTAIESGGSLLIVDAGISRKRMFGLMRDAGLFGGDERDDVDGLLLTHEHVDHGGFARQYERHSPTPVVASAGTAEALGLQRPVLARPGPTPAAAPSPAAPAAPATGLPGDNRHRANSALDLQHPIDRPRPRPLWVLFTLPESTLRTWLWRPKTARHPRPYICPDPACLLRSHPGFFSLLRRTWILSRFLYRMPWLVVRAHRNQLATKQHIPDHVRLH